jgi:oligoendopeptidase F
VSATVTGAEAVEWDLTDLYDGPDDPRWQSELEQAIADANDFRERFHGRVSSLDAQELAAAVTEVERIRSNALRAAIYARLRYAADASDESRGAQAQRAQEAGTAVETALLFFDLEWAALADERAEELLSDVALAHYANVLRAERRYRPHLLSEPE